jgi:toxin YoeB
MTIAFTPAGWETYQYRCENDVEIIEKINELIKAIARDPFQGIGKPEPLRGNLKGYWSRRIAGEHRIVYRISGSKPDHVLTIISVRFHYTV